MQVSQVKDLVNTATNEAIGKEVIQTDDLSDVVDAGKQLAEAGDIGLDNYVKSLANQVGYMKFVDRVYKGVAPSILRQGWEYGSILEKITMNSIPQAMDSESWQLENGASYDPNIFYKPDVSAKFFNSKTTYQIPMSFTRMQVKESFQNAEQLNAFVSMLQNAVQKSISVKSEQLVLRALDNAIALTLDGGESPRVVKLLTDYNTLHGTQLTKEQAKYDPDFKRYEAITIGLYKDRLRSLSTLFNAGGMDRFTPEEDLHIVYLSEFMRTLGGYLYDATGQFKNENIVLPEGETVNFWQGSGKNFAFEDTSSINVKDSSNNTVQKNGIVAVMFDHEAVAACNTDRRVTSKFNEAAEFYTNRYFCDESYINDMNENFVVFIEE